MNYFISDKIYHAKPLVEATYFPNVRIDQI